MQLQDKAIYLQDGTPNQQSFYKNSTHAEKN